MAELFARSRFFRFALVLLCVGLFGCDHATKVAAETALAGGRAVTLAPGVLELRYARNDDTAFSLLHYLHVARSPALLLAVSLVALLGIAIAWVVARRRAGLAQHVGYALVLAGALGNVVDRAMHGYVVDFIHLSHWPTFNVADIAVVVGVLLLVMTRKRAPNAPSPPSAPGPPGPPAAPTAAT
jgi:signal peptidase II